MSEKQEGPQSDKPETEPGEYWLPLGLALGAAMGLVLDNIAIGIAMGLAVGLAIQAAHRNKNN
jgi:hypothetical protein